VSEFQDIVLQFVLQSWQRHQYNRQTDLDACFVDVRIISAAALTSLAENDYFLKEEDSSEALVASMVDGEVGLPQQHSLLLKVHLHTVNSPSVTLHPHIPRLVGDLNCSLNSSFILGFKQKFGVNMRKWHNH